jgi:hypothetical protein
VGILDQFTRAPFDLLPYVYITFKVCAHVLLFSLNWICAHLLSDCPVFRAYEIQMFLERVNHATGAREWQLRDEDFDLAQEIARSVHVRLPGNCPGF